MRCRKLATFCHSRFRRCSVISSLHFLALRRNVIHSVFCSRRSFPSGICSCEHESHLTMSMGARVAQADPETSADGIEFMDSTPKRLIAALEAIRDMAANALNQIRRSQEEHSMRWKCKGCRYIKHFTRPVALEAAGRCPRCKSTEFRPIL
jgi:predicted Zn-ribbon and HTH transcriptional regulator